jgi:hypothetical protein
MFKVDTLVDIRAIKPTSEVSNKNKKVYDVDYLNGLIIEEKFYAKSYKKTNPTTKDLSYYSDASYLAEQRIFDNERKILAQ